VKERREEIIMKAEEIKNKTSEAVAYLVDALQSGQSEVLSDYLTTMARFHNYSFGNIMLIAPDADGNAGCRNPHLELAWPLRQARRERHFDSGSAGGRGVAEVNLPRKGNQSQDSQYNSGVQTKATAGTKIAKKRVQLLLAALYITADELARSVPNDNIDTIGQRTKLAPDRLHYNAVGVPTIFQNQR